MAEPGSSADPPVFDRIFRRYHLQNCACFLNFKRYKNGTPFSSPHSYARKLLKEWLLRLDSNQQPSG
jgi:hypothetical protein